MGPATEGDECPYRFNQPERPRPLKESISRAKAARRRECQDEPRAVFFERVADQHRCDGEQAESRNAIHDHAGRPAFWLESYSASAPYRATGPRISAIARRAIRSADDRPR